MVMHTPSGWLADRFGGKIMLSVPLIVASVITASTPAVIVYGGAYALMASRFALGVAMGGVFPALNVILSAWVPPEERGRMSSVVICGGAVRLKCSCTFVLVLIFYRFLISQMGSSIGSFFSGLILHYHSNWAYVFYYYAAFGVITTILFVCLQYTYIYYQIEFKNCPCEWFCRRFCAAVVQTIIHMWAKQKNRICMKNWSKWKQTCIHQRHRGKPCWLVGPSLLYSSALYVWNDWITALTCYINSPIFYFIDSFFPTTHFSCSKRTYRNTWTMCCTWASKRIQFIHRFLGWLMCQCPCYLASCAIGSLQANVWA